MYLDFKRLATLQWYEMDHRHGATTKDGLDMADLADSEGEDPQLDALGGCATIIIK
jgi:hypothetical protein